MTRIAKKNKNVGIQSKISEMIKAGTYARRTAVKALS
jgi:hypothetical protein